MPELPQKKVGIIACSGEELPVGTVTRLAALRVLEQLRPGSTVTICLPLFLAGGVEDRAFARFHPTITVDGCDLRCAARATERYSSKPVASIVVNDLVAECGLSKPEGRRQLNEAGRQAVAVTAEHVAALVDQALGKDGSTAVSDESAEAAPHGNERETACSCGSGIPVTKLVIAGETVEMVALPLIFRQFREAGRSQTAAATEDLFETVKIYNSVPPGSEKIYRAAVNREYATYCQQEEKKP